MQQNTFEKLNGLLKTLEQMPQEEYLAGTTIVNSSIEQVKKGKELTPLTWTLIGVVEKFVNEWLSKNNNN